MQIGVWPRFAYDGRRKAQVPVPVLRHLAALVGKELSGETRIRAQRHLRVPQLRCVERLQPLQLLRAAQLRGELGRLLVALNQRALDVLLLAEGAAGNGKKKENGEPHRIKTRSPAPGFRGCRARTPAPLAPATSAFRRCA